MRAAACGERAPRGETCSPAMQDEESARRRAAARARRDTGRLVDSTQAEDRRMIALVAERPLLYARSTLPVASYYTQVKALWLEVADIMGWTVAEVRRKWSHIRNSYSRHLRNEIHGMRTGKGRMVSKWYLADELEFLRRHMATDTRPTPYSMVPMPPSLLEMELGSAGEEDSKLTPPQPWYAAPEPAPRSGDSCAGFELDENSAYFQFFRAIYKDYQELTPRKQRYFRRKCLILLHGLVDGEAAERAILGEEGEEEAMNLSCGYSSDSEREQKLFVQVRDVTSFATNPVPEAAAAAAADADAR